jgi:hypothetical protein
MTRRLVLALAAQLLTGAAAAQVPEEPLGRLFFTPEQRAALDAGRRIATKKSGSQPTRTSGPKSVQLNGIILRSDGARTVWINNKAYQDRNPGGIRVEVQDPAAAQIQVGRGGPKVDLQVGEVYDQSAGKVGNRLEVTEPGKSR